MWQAARTFDPARGEFRSWLYKVAINATRSEMSLKRHRQEIQEEDLSDREPPNLMLPVGGRQTVENSVRFAVPRR